MMDKKQLTDDLKTMLEIIAKEGGTDCSGTCHHRKPGEFHCHVFGTMMGLSSQGIKNRILKLLRLGLLERHRIERKDTYPLTRFVISKAGMDVLAENDN